MEQTEQVAQSISKNKRPLIFAIICIVILLAGGFGYRYWLHTPQYSLKQIQEAVAKHDLQAFEKYVDIDSVTSRVIDQFIESRMNSQSEVQDEATNNLMRGFVQVLKPQLTALAKEQIRSFVEKGSTEQQPGQKKQAPQNAPNFSVDDLYRTKSGAPDFKGIDYVNKDGKIAIVGLKLFYPKLNSDIVLEIKMRELDGYWQVAEINNLDTFLERIENLEKEKLAVLNKPIIDEMKKSVTFNSIKMVPVQVSAYSKAITFPTEITFLSPKNITGLEALILVKNQQGKLLLKFPIHSEGTGFAGKTATVRWSKDINPFIRSDVALFNTPSDQLLLEIQPRSMKFADGSELKLAEKLP